MTVHSIFLSGCAPTPLAHYLKALGILRLVAEQKDPDASGFWKNEGFVLQSTLDEAALLSFFLKEYQPTSIIAPWNGGSGFYYQEAKSKELDAATGKKRKSGVRSQPTEATRTVDVMLSSKARRFTEYRQLLEVSRQMLTANNFQESPKDEQKNSMLQIIRNSFPDSFLIWLDAALLISHDQTFFPPLLGTGGNDGNLDFSNNFMQRQLQLFGAEDGVACQSAYSWLTAALFNTPTSKLQKDVAIGQFLPGNVGGPNATAGFDAKSLINPWDFVMMMEGALFFAASASRRFQQANSGCLSYPFTVRNTGSGSGSSSQTDEAKKARAEIWLPLWQNPASFTELKVLFQEGRATVGRRPAKDGLDFARAISTLGVDRGISEFQRYGFMKRSGDAYLATPIGRLQTSHNPATELIQELDKTRFLDALRSLARKEETPGRIVALVRQLENRLFELTRSKRPNTVQDILILLGQLQHILSISSKGRDSVRKPAPLLSTAWLANADDGTPEFRLACALASISSKDLPIRIHFASIKPKEQAWDEHSRLAVWGEGAFTNNMTALLRTRLLAAERLQLKDKPFDFGFGVNCQDIRYFLDSITDDQHIGDLTRGLSLLENISGQSIIQREHKPVVLPGAYAVLKPFFTPDQILMNIGFLPSDKDKNLPFRAEILALLTANRCDEAVKLAWDKLKHVGVALPLYPNQPPTPIAMDGPRLLAALVFPLERRQLQSLLQRIKKPSEQAEKFI